ncbi:nuclear transport factor 2 family protein [Occallatibacter riparius]|uniref:Nuclear transport factor 2 family protein n=1 Tax=Occallatibacter riparius TaxID=1002689 RepID=A0A9J7BM16_9BACT|nr:nuclear transport factor 2 family protein [Occallatibacter riparius]UWZ82810.1 nuclear transport factor 2 family protein [Occallatibacter riparius]
MITVSNGARRFRQGRYYTFALIVVVTASAYPLAAAQALSLQSKKELKESFQRQEQLLMDSVAIGDKHPWNNTLDDDCIITNEEGEVLTKKTFLEQLAGLPGGLSGSIEVAELTVQRVSDSVAVVRFRMNEKETVFGQQLTTSYRSTDTFVRKGTAWKMIASHQSLITSNPPTQEVSKANWPAFAGTYQLLPNGWVVHVVLRNGQLYSGRDLNDLKRLIPIGPNVFTREGDLGEWIFCLDEKQKATKIVELRKFEPLVWTFESEGP